MRKLAWLAVLSLMASAVPALADEFANLKCGVDIPKALIGKTSSNGRVMATEAKYRSLGLTHTGSDETSDQLWSVGWMICGKEYIMLQDKKGLIRDVIEFPPHSKKSPAYSGVCEFNGKKLPDVFTAVLNAEVAGDMIPALAAWKIDLKAAKFIKASTEGLRCPRSDVYTIDGGR